MGICRFYQQGYCRFGDRCKYEHPRSLNGSYDARDVISHRSGYGESYNAYQGQRGGHGQSSYNTNQGGRYGTSNYSNQGDRGRFANDYQSHNRFQPLDNQGGESSKPNTQQTQNFREMSTDSIIEALSETIDMWQQGRMWLLSCVSLGGDSPCLPGFEDLSPEEVRLKAYEAKTSGSTATFQQWIAQLSNDVQAKRTNILKPDASTRKELNDVIANMKNYSQSQSPSSVFGDSKPSVTSEPTGLFGKPTNQSTGLFGKPGNESTGLFGKPANQSAGLFGKPAEQPSTNLFSKATGQPTTLFGQPVSGTGTFGASTTGSVFGGSSQAQSGGLFGGQTATEPMASNSSSSTDLNTNTPFAPANQNNANSLFGQTSNSPFGRTNQASANFFGQPAPSPTFSPITQDNSNKTFGQQTGVQSPSFGASPVVPQTTSFGGSVITQPSAFSTHAVSQTSTSVSVPVTSTTTGAAPAQSTHVGKLDSIYTPLDKLTAEDRAQYQAPKFVLGKIPLCPPPRELI